MMQQNSPRMCPKCHQKPKQNGQSYCAECRKEYQRSRYKTSERNQGYAEIGFDLDNYLDPTTGTLTRCVLCELDWDMVSPSQEFPPLCFECFEIPKRFNYRTEKLRLLILIMKDNKFIEKFNLDNGDEDTSAVKDDRSYISDEDIEALNNYKFDE